MDDEQSDRTPQDAATARVGRLKRDELPPERVVVGAEIVLAIILFARAAAAISLAGWLTLSAPGWSAVFHGIASYALVDGGLALMIGVLFAVARYRGGPVALVAMSFVDAIVRVCLGVTIIKVPAIADLPMTIVPLFGVVGATAAFLGGIAILSWAVAHHRRRREHSIAYEALFDPIPVIALVCIVIGARLIIDPPAGAEQLRRLVAAGGVWVAIGFAIASVGSLLEWFRACAVVARQRIAHQKR